MRRKLTDIETHHTGHGERDRLMIHTETYTNMQKYTDTSINPHSITKTPTPKQAWVTKAYTSKHKSPTHQSLGHTYALKATHFTPSFIGVQVCSSEFWRTKGWNEHSRHEVGSRGHGGQRTCQLWKGWDAAALNP